MGMTTGRAKVQEAALDALAVVASISGAEVAQLTLIDAALSADVADDPIYVAALSHVRAVKTAASMTDAQAEAIQAEMALEKAIKIDFSDMSLGALRAMKAEELRRLGACEARLRELIGKLQDQGHQQAA